MCIDFEKAYDSVQKGIYNILIEFGTTMELVTVRNL
jgi:hypothetical protein